MAAPPLLPRSGGPFSAPCSRTIPPCSNGGHLPLDGRAAIRPARAQVQAALEERLRLRDGLLAPVLARQRQPARQGRPHGHRPEPARPRRAGLQAPPRGRPAGHHARGPAHRRQPARRHRSWRRRPGGSSQGRRAGSPAPRPARLMSEEAPCRQGGCSRRRACRRRGIVPRIARHAIKSSERTGAALPRGRAHPVPDRPWPPPGRPLRAPRRHPPRLPRPRLPRDLLRMPPKAPSGGCPVETHMRHLRRSVASVARAGTTTARRAPNSSRQRWCPCSFVADRARSGLRWSCRPAARWAVAAGKHPLPAPGPRVA